VRDSRTFQGVIAVCQGLIMRESGRITSVMTDQVFPDIDTTEWRESTTRFLKGKPFETLVRSTLGGISRGPLFTADDLPALLAPISNTEVPQLDGRPWHIMVPVRDPDLTHANSQLLEDLKGGASGAVIYYDNMTDNLRKSLFFERLFDGVYTDLTPLIFRDGAEAITIESGRKRLENCHVHLGASPLDWMSPEDVDILPKTWRAFVISDPSVERYGQPATEEIARLAYLLARGFERHGAARIMAHTTIELIANQDAHLGIAKIRAARRVFARIAEVFEAKTTDFPIFSITSTRMMQPKDPWTNMLRVMNAGFGAVVGGADYVLTRPFTDASNANSEPLATGFAHRLARNMQLLMMEESHLGQVHDAAFGSYWHEAMTEQLAQAAWSRFQELSTFTTLPSLEETAPLPAPPAVGVDIHPAPKDMPMPEVRTV